MTDAPVTPTVVWIDIPVVDVERAIRFYAAVLAKPVHRQEIPGGLIGILPHGDGAIGGCLALCTHGNPGGDGPLVYLDCGGRLDAAVSAVTANGGTVLQPVHSIAPHGRRAVIRDSEGNHVALHAP